MKITKKKIVYTIIGAVIILIGFSIYKSATKKPEYILATAKKMDLVQEVSVTGRVKAAESADLAFERSGKAAYVYAKVGDKVWPGRKLAELDNGELVANLLQAQANLQAEQARLSEMQKGTRPEEIKIAETNLANAKSDAEAALKKVYESALTSTSEAVVKAKNALLTLTDIQSKYFTGTDQDSLAIANTKRPAVYALLGLDNAGRLATEELSKLEGGAFGAVKYATSNPTFLNIDEAIIRTTDALQKVKLALDTVKISTEFTTTEKTDLSTAKTTVGTEISTISAKEQVIAVQETTNINNIKTAENSLELKRAGSTPEQLEAEEAKVKSLEAAVGSAQAQLLKTIIFSPISGIITKQEVTAGEIISANHNVISVISEKKFEIEANVAEADIAKITAGDIAQITLDAYGNEVIFEASIIKIDPAETIVEGVPTYKTTLQFTNEDGRIKSGMTANLDILTDRREGVIALPSRAITGKNGNKTVKVLKDGKVNEVAVSIGLRSTDGFVEIIQGISENDTVVMDIKK